MIEVSLRALRERHPECQWTRHVGTNGAGFAYRGVRDGYAVTLVPYVQDCREGGEMAVRGGVYQVLREVPRYLWLQQSNTGDPQSLYTGVLHGTKSAFDVALDTPQEVRSAPKRLIDFSKTPSIEGTVPGTFYAPVECEATHAPAPQDPESWVLLGG